MKLGHTPVRDMDPNMVPNTSLEFEKANNWTGHWWRHELEMRLLKELQPFSKPRKMIRKKMGVELVRPHPRTGHSASPS